MLSPYAVKCVSQSRWRHCFRTPFDDLAELARAHVDFVMRYQRRACIWVHNERRLPPAPIRVLRDYTRLREDLTRERTRYWQRLEKLFEDAAIKISAVASTLDTLSTRGSRR